LTSSMKNFPLDGQSSYKTEAVVFAPTDEAWVFYNYFLVRFRTFTDVMPHLS
jgi:hypothetical protein